MRSRCATRVEAIAPQVCDRLIELFDVQCLVIRCGAVRHALPQQCLQREAPTDPPSEHRALNRLSEVDAPAWATGALRSPSGLSWNAHGRTPRPGSGPDPMLPVA